jgi:hypothetical protein
MLHPKIFLLSLFVLLSAGFLCAQQTLTGTVTDEKNNPIPFARVYVKNSADLRVEANVHGVYEMRLFEGEYFLVFTATGYEDREAYVTISKGGALRDIQLFPADVKALDNVVVSAQKSNPGRDIMLQVVKIRDRINPWNYPHTVDVYIKASEKITPTGKGKKNKQEAADADGNKLPSDTPADPFEAEKQKELDKVKGMNLVEIQLQRNFAPPGQVREYRNAYTKRGTDQRLYYTTTVKSNFNFFQNLMHLDDLHQSPVSSPISGPGIMSYKYRLEDQYLENGQLIDKIRIIPRNIATTTLSGYIYVIDSLWLVQKLELTMQKGNLLAYDYFTIQQTFDHPGDTMCVLTSQTLIYGNKFQDEISECRTAATFSNYVFNPQFSNKFFGNELSETRQEAYTRDSTFWSSTRTVELSSEEKRYILLKDSIRDRLNRVEYLDSIDKVFNKVTFWKVAWFGVDHRNRERKTQWGIQSVAGSVQPIYIAGPRISPGFNFFKKWEDQRSFDFASDISIGLLNSDVKGSLWGRYLYDPFHFGTIGASFSHDFDVIRSYDAITQIYKRDNFIQTTELSVSHDREYLNGLYINPSFSFSERRDVTQYEFVTLLDSVLANNSPTKFQSYQAAIFSVTVSYVPGQKFMREPNRKVVLGSKWPTFYMFYEKGIPKLFGSDVNHDYLLLGIRQTFKIGTLGTSNYNLMSGKFLNAKQLKDADFKYQRRSDPIWFSNPLYSFQDQDSSLPSRKIYYEGHFIHHENGALLNKIPFMKKTGIGLVVGVGALYVKEYNWQHYEALAGLERNFKIFKQRLRIGVYGVLSDGNHIAPTTTWKVSFAFLNYRNMKWNF